MTSPAPSCRPEPVLVTGGTGLLGRHVVEALRRCGDEVRVLVREGSDAPVGCEVVRGDLADATARRAAVDSVRAVYHLAAVTAKWLPDQGVFDRVNVDAAVALARDAAAAGVERVVHVSSFTVFGPGRGGVAVDERALAAEAALQNDYQRSKHRAHVALTELARRGAVPVVLACPGVVYGTGPEHLRNPIAELLVRQLQGRLRCFPGLARRWTLAWAPDVAAGLRLLRQRGTIGDAYLLGGPTVALREVCAWVAERSGRAAPRALPLWPLLALGLVAQGVARLRKAPTPPRFSAAALRFLRHSWAFSSAEAAALGCRSSQLEDCLRALWADLHERHLVSDQPPAAVPAA